MNPSNGSVLSFHSLGAFLLQASRRSVYLGAITIAYYKQHGFCMADTGTPDNLETSLRESLLFSGIYMVCNRFVRNESPKFPADCSLHLVWLMMYAKTYVLLAPRHTNSRELKALGQ